MVVTESYDMNCYCHSGINYGNCCKLFIEDGYLPDSVDKLMRSRFTAFCAGSSEYLKNTWIKEEEPQDLSSEPMNWVHLNVLGFSNKVSNPKPPIPKHLTHYRGEITEIGSVEFEAILIEKNSYYTHKEKSIFFKLKDKWLYAYGEIDNLNSGMKKLSMSMLCPCDSGLKVKRCHGK